MSQNVIELNGKRYDAITGAFLGKSEGGAVPVAAHHRVQGRVIDGFIRQSAAKPGPKSTTHHVPAAGKAKVTPVKGAAATATPAKGAPKKPALAAPATAAATAPTAPLHHTGHTHVHAPAKNAERHRPEHAKTLMRHTVHKPEMHLKPAIKPQAPAEVMARPASAIARKRSVAQVDPSRLQRATAIVKHAAVRRFQPNKTGVGPAALAVRHSSGPVPVIPVRALPAAAEHPHGPAQPADIFEAAIRRANSHEQPMHKPRRARRRMVNVMAAGAAFVVLGGFITYLNLPNIQMHIASVEAGFHASMPSYRPTGYAMRGGIHHSGGTISMSFVSGDSSYTVTEQSSSWDSQTLLDNTLALAGAHQTIQQGGRTIYVYGNGANAAWVTGDVRYDITGNAVLSADELASIAASM